MAVPTAEQQAQAQAAQTVAADTSAGSPAPGYVPTTGSTVGTNTTNDLYQAPSGTVANMVIPRSTTPLTVKTPSTPPDSVLLEELAKFVGLPDKKGKQSTEEIIKRLEERVGVGKTPSVAETRRKQIAARTATTATGAPAEQGASKGKPAASDFEAAKPTVSNQFGNASDPFTGNALQGIAGESEAQKEEGKPAAKPAPASAPAKPPAPTPTLEKNGLTYTWREDPRLPGTSVWVAVGSDGQPVLGEFPPPKEAPAQSKKVGLAKSAGEASDALSPQEQQQVAQIAAHIGANGTSLADVAAKLNIQPNGTAVSATTALASIGGQTVAQAAAAFYRSISGHSPAAKAQLSAWTKDLEAAGMLDTDQGNATPDANDVANAYVQKLLVPAAQANQNPAQYYQGQIHANVLPAGGQSSSEAEAYVQGVATQFGVTMTPDQITHVSNLFTAEGDVTTTQLDAVQDQIKDAVMSYYDATSSTPPTGGVAAQIYQDIQQAALQYQVPMSAQGINAMVKSAIEGASISTPYQAASSATGAATLQFQKQAMALYPQLSKQIQEGYTVQSLVDPYNQVAQEYTGVPASTITQETPAGGPPNKWNAFLNNGPVDPESGKPGMMTLDQWKTQLMQDPQYGFANTQGGKNLASQMASAILNEFGKVNTDSSSGQPFGALSPSSALSVNSGPS